MMKLLSILAISFILLLSESSMDVISEIDKNESKSSGEVINVSFGCVMKKERIYHAKNIQYPTFKNSGDGFLIFTGKGNYYNLLSDSFSSFTVDELKEIIQKDKSNGGNLLLEKGAYAVDKGTYRARDGYFYTFFERKKIEVFSPNHIRFDGYDYYLEMLEIMKIKNQ